MSNVVEAILASPWTSLGAGFLFIVLDRRISEGTNFMLFGAWAFFVVALYRLPMVLDQPIVPRVLWTMLLASVLGLVMHKTLWTPEASSKAETGASDTTTNKLTPPLPPKAGYIRTVVETLVHEIKLVSGKQFRNECPVVAPQKLGDEQPPKTMFAFTPDAKFTVVQSLRPLTSAFANVYAGFLFEPNPPTFGGRRITEGYERVYQAYSNLLSKPWVVWAYRYADGAPLIGDETFNQCLYGLRDVDETVLKRLVDSLDEAESALRKRPLPKPTPVAARTLSVKCGKFQSSRLKSHDENREPDLLCLTDAIYLTNHTSQPLNLIPQMVLQVQAGVVPFDVLTREALKSPVDDEMRSRMQHGDMTQSKKLSYLGRVIHVPANSTIDGYLAFVFEGALFDLVKFQGNDLWAAIRTATNAKVQFENRQTGEKVSAPIPGDTLSSSPVAEKPKKLASPAQWRHLAGEFKGMDTGIRADWSKSSAGEHWRICGGMVQANKDCRTLCMLGGKMLLASPNVAASLAPQVRDEADPVNRWLYHIKSTTHDFKMDLHGFEVAADGSERAPVYGGSIDGLAAVCRRACIECAALET